MKKTMYLLMAILLLASAAACSRTRPADTAAADTEQPAPTAAPETPAADTPSERQDGERFETVILIEGMEETVRYEHILNDTIGIEMDYDYESLLRQRDAVSDRFISIYDDPEDPQNYLELQSSEGITEAMAYNGVSNYCHRMYDWSIAEEDPSIMYLAMGEESDTAYQVVFRSYTGAVVYFSVDKSMGNASMTEFDPTLNRENEAGSFNLYEYLVEQD